MIAGVQVPAVFGVMMGLDIPAGEKAYTMKDSFTLPDGTKKWLLWIKDWDFGWHDQYHYKAPVALPKGTRIDVAITYDNSEDNPSHPAKRVKWGEQSFDEMGSVTVQVAPVRERPLRMAHKV